MSNRDHRRLVAMRAALGLAALSALVTIPSEAQAATQRLPRLERVKSSRPLAINLPASRSANTAVEQNTDADDGEVQAAGEGVSFGRALDLQGTPLRLASLRPKNVGVGLFIPGLYTGPFELPTGMPVRADSVSSGFGTRWHPLFGGYRFHAGIDLVAPAGAHILATSPGVVAEAGWCGGYGYCVTIDHGRGYHTLYGHLSQLDVRTGDRVSAGQLLGLVGSTGHSTGPHLHYEVRLNSRPVDPRRYLGR